MNFDDNSLYNIKSSVDGKRYSLFELATWKNGLAFKKINFCETGVPVIKIAELNNGIGGTTAYTQQTFSEDVHLCKGDLLFSWSGNPQTSIDIFRFNLDEGWLNQHIFKVTPNEKTVDRDYFYFLMKNLKPHFTQIATNKQTTGLGHVTIADIKRMSIVIPSLDVQREIVSYIKPIDDKIELNNEINNNLEQQAKTLFKSWFVDFELFDESLVDSPIGTKIPHSLQMVQIGSLSHILETGKRPKGGAVATGVPSIGAENVKRLGEVDFASAKYIPVEFAQKMDKGKVHGYELMLYKDGGKPGTFIPHFSMFGEGFPYDDFYINEHVFKLDFGDKGFNEFCYFYLQTDYPYNWLANNGGKAAVPGINQQDVNSIWIYHPDNPIVKEYCKWVQPIFTTILRNCSQNVKLSQLRDTLLPKLMSGELDVSNVEI